MLLVDWQFVRAKTKSSRELDVFATIEAQLAALAFLHDHMRRLQEVLHQYQAVWQQLMQCQRSELMCCIPLAAERIADLHAAASDAREQSQRARVALLAAVQALQTFAAVNRSTADEIESDGLVTRAIDKRALADYEDRLAAQLAGQLLGGSAGHAAAPRPRSNAPGGGAARQRSASAGPAFAGAWAAGGAGPSRLPRRLLQQPRHTPPPLHRGLGAADGQPLPGSAPAPSLAQQQGPGHTARHSLNGQQQQQQPLAGMPADGARLGVKRRSVWADLLDAAGDSSTGEGTRPAGGAGAAAAEPSTRAASVVPPPLPQQQPGGHQQQQPPPEQQDAAAGLVVQGGEGGTMRQQEGGADASAQAAGGQLEGAAGGGGGAGGGTAGAAMRQAELPSAEPRLLLGSAGSGGGGGCAAESQQQHQQGGGGGGGGFCSQQDVLLAAGGSQ